MLEALSLLSNALIAGVLLSIAIALVGSLMLITRSNYLAASIAHGSYGGVGIALFLGISIVLGATLFALALALLLAYLTYKESKRLDILIGVLWAVGMSIGIIFADLTPGYHTDLLSYLFGDILMVPKSDLIYMIFVDMAAFLFISIFYHHILVVAYDREFALTRGIDVGLIHTLTLLLIALTVVMSIRSIGLILVIALFSIPPYIGEKLTNSFTKMMMVSGVIALCIITIGLFLAYIFDISATAAIILFGALVFGIVFVKYK